MSSCLMRLLFAECSNLSSSSFWKGFDDFEVSRRALAGCLSAASAAWAQQWKSADASSFFTRLPGCEDSLGACCLRFTKVERDASFICSHKHFSPYYEDKKNPVSVKSFESLIMINSSSHVSSRYDIQLPQTIWITEKAGNLTTMRNVSERVKYFTVSQQLLKCHKLVPRTAESFDRPSGVRGLFITRRHTNAACVNWLDNYSSSSPKYLLIPQTVDQPFCPGTTEPRWSTHRAKRRNERWSVGARAEGKARTARKSFELKWTYDPTDETHHSERNSA